MYQFYYSDNREYQHAELKQKISDHFNVDRVRPTMWEEHCLECSAPVCFGNCAHYAARRDGRCMRFDNGIRTFENASACCGQGARLKFRKWANMMTIIYPGMLSPEEYSKLTAKNEKLGKRLRSAVNSKLPTGLKWQYIRTIEYLRRRRLRRLAADTPKPDAFVFHGYSYGKESFNLIMEVFDGHTPLFRQAIPISQGENLTIIPGDKLLPCCSTPGYLVKLYPENDIEAELDILWCDFVQGGFVEKDAPAEKVKCLVWDLDNTLWNGILIETEDNESLELKAGVLETIKKLDERGIIQSIASKNDFAPAMEQLEKLGISEYFLYPEIHWNAKSASIKNIAANLNIGVDAMAFIDDSVFEREQVHSALPEVRTYDALEVEKLTELPEFDVIVTDESRHRREMYRAEEKRNALMASGNDDTVSFLRKCNLRIKVFAPQTEADITRCFELVNRTNQLNMSGRRYTRNEFDALLSKIGQTSIAFSCRDDFGSYGIVGFMQYRKDNCELCFTEFAMSCRVACKYVESALFTHVLNDTCCEKGTLTVHKTKKQVLLRKTFESIGFAVEQANAETVKYDVTLPLMHSDLVRCTG